MDESLTAEARAVLKTSAIERLRSLADELERTEATIREYRGHGPTQMTSPHRREWFNEALRDLQRAGENIPNWMIRRPDTMKFQPVKGAPREDWIDGSTLLADIKRVLALVDPPAE